MRSVIERASSVGGQRSLLGVFAAVFLLNLGYGMVVPIIPLYARSYGASSALIGLMLSAVAAGRIALQIPAGAIADRVDERIVAAGGLALYAPAMLGMALLPSPTVFVPLRLLEGCAEGIGLPALYAIVSTRCQPDRVGTAFGLFTSSATAGLALAPAIGGVAVSIIGPRLLFGLVAAGAGAAAVVLALGVGPPRGDARPEHTRASSLAALRMLTTAQALPMLPSMAASAASRMAFAALLAVVPLAVTDVLHVGNEALGLLFTLNFAVFSFGQPLAGWISDRSGTHRDLPASLVVMGLTFGLLGYASSFPLFSLTLVVEALAGCWVVVASRRLAASAAGAVGHGKTFAVVGVAGDAGSLVGPVLATSLYGVGVRLPFLLITAVSGLALLTMLPSPRRQDRPEP